MPEDGQMTQDRSNTHNIETNSHVRPPDNGHYTWDEAKTMHKIVEIEIAGCQNFRLCMMYAVLQVHQSFSHWRPELPHTSSEGERLMLEALVESSRGGRRTVLQYIKMLSVIALPVAAVIVLVSYTLHNMKEIQGGCPSQRVTSVLPRHLRSRRHSSQQPH